MIDAIALRARTLVVAADGSATTDGGVGACAAITGNGGLRDARVVELSDVTTPFEDAAVVSGPQKGADERQV